MFASSLTHPILLIAGIKVLCQRAQHRILPAKERRGTLLAIHFQGQEEGALAQNRL